MSSAIRVCLGIALALGASGPGQEESGWTRRAPSQDSRVLHVSSKDGDDSRDGSIEHPFKTIARAKTFLRHGFPDWLLLKAGDVWTETLGTWKAGGRSRSEPLVVASYGQGPRPRLVTGGEIGLFRMPGGGAPATLEHLAVIGLDFYEKRRDPSAEGFDPKRMPENPGLFWVGDGADILIEDCRFSFFKDGMAFQKQKGTSLTDVRIRRCVVLDSYSAKAHSQGFYAEEVDGLLLEENLFDHNGWNEAVAAAERTMFNHNLYIQSNCRRVSVRNNILARAASHAVQLRCGGVIENNFMPRNAIGVTTAGEQVTVEDNVVLESDDIGPTQPRGWGILMARHSGGAVYRRNVLLNRRSTLTTAGLVMSDVAVPGAPPVAIIDNVVSGWNSSRGGIFVAEPDRADVKLSGNVVDGKDSDGKAVKQLDPKRTLETYMDSLGLRGGLDGFLAEGRRREGGTWEPRWSADGVNRYFRAGFVPSR